MKPPAPKTSLSQSEKTRLLAEVSEKTGIPVKDLTPEDIFPPGHDRGNIIVRGLNIFLGNLWVKDRHFSVLHLFGWIGFTSWIGYFAYLSIFMPTSSEVYCLIGFVLSPAVILFSCYLIATHPSRPYFHNVLRNTLIFPAFCGLGVIFLFIRHSMGS